MIEEQVKKKLEKYLQEEAGQIQDLTAGAWDEEQWKKYDLHLSAYFTGFCDRHGLVIDPETKKQQEKGPTQFPYPIGLRKAHDPSSLVYLFLQFLSYGKGEEYRLDIQGTNFEVAEAQELCDILEPDHIVLNGQHFQRFDRGICAINEKIKDGTIQNITFPCAAYNNREIERACAYALVFLDRERTYLSRMFWQKTY